MIPKELGFVLSRYISTMYKLPKLTKGFIIKNTLNTTNEEILRNTSLLPLMRFFYPHLKRIVGVLDYTETQERDERIYVSEADVAVLLRTEHKCSNHRILVGGDFKFYLSTSNSFEQIPNASHFDEAFFHVLDKVSETKNNSVAIELLAFSNWTTIQNYIMFEVFKELFGADIDVAHNEYQNIAPLFEDLFQKFINSLCYRTPGEDLAELVLEVPVYKFVKDSELHELLLWLFESLTDIINMRIDLLQNSLHELKEGEFVDLVKTKNMQEVLLKSFLEYTGNDVYLDVKNLITKTVTLKDLENYKKHFKKTLDNIKNSIPTIKVSWD
ncbi:DNA-directed RNA polymerase, 35 kD subunit [Carp edema virus]|nr:DNA-directed RNA polymerase, 35 kD subunit [Carp edema virus]